MSERTFRAVVAAVLVGALLLAILVVADVLPRPTQPTPSPTIGGSPTPSASNAESAAPTEPPGPAFAAPEVVSVGVIQRGTTSGPALVLTFTESGIDAIPDAPGSFRVTLTDSAADGSTAAFVGTPAVDAPGSLGATARLVAPNVLQVDVEASDTLNLEPIVIKGLSIRVSASAALGALRLQLGGFEGSLVGGAASDVMAAPGTVVAGQ